MIDPRDPYRHLRRFYYLYPHHWWNVVVRGMHQKEAWDVVVPQAVIVECNKDAWI